MRIFPEQATSLFRKDVTFCPTTSVVKYQVFRNQEKSLKDNPRDQHFTQYHSPVSKNTDMNSFTYHTMQKQHLKNHTNHITYSTPYSITQAYTAYTNNCRESAVTYIATNTPNPVMNMK